MTLAPPLPLPRPFAQRVLQMVSWAGLAFSLAVLIVSAPHLLKIGGGAGLVLGNIAQFAWTLALLLVVFGRRRTVGARALGGAALAGFFGVASLAVLAGKPLVDRFGNDSDVVTLLFAPVSEEAIKLLLPAIFLLLATRSRRWRPSACDAVLLGFTVGAGFAVYENILFARGTSGGWFANVPLSLVLPTIASRGQMLAGGHAVYTGLATIGLAVTVLYGGRFRLARFALPAALLLVIVEHITVNRFAMYSGMFSFLDPGAPLWAQFALLLTMHGYLSSVLFVAGVGAIAVFEKRLAC